MSNESATAIEGEHEKETVKLSAHPIDKKKKKKVELADHHHIAEDLELADHHHVAKDLELAEHDPEEDEEDEDDEKPFQDGKLFIEDKGRTFIFQTSKSEEQNQSRRVAGEGIEAITVGKFGVIRAFEFDKQMWTFDQVHAWLVDQGFSPSESEPAAFMMETDEDVERVIFSLPSGSLSQKVKFVLNTEENVLDIVGLAITPGVHRNFKFTREMLSRFVNRWHKVRLLMDHVFQHPGHVVGYNRKERMTAEGIEVESRIFDDEAMKAVASGKVRALSSNFLLRTSREIGVDGSKLVMSIDGILELTLTPTPQDQGSTISAHKLVRMSEDAPDANLASPTLLQFNSPPVTMEANGENMSEEPPTTETTQTPAPAPATEGSTSKETPTPAEPQQQQLSQQENLQLTQKVDQLERVLKKQMGENVVMQKDLDSISNQRHLELSEQKANTLIGSGKFPAHLQRPITALYESFTQEQESMFHEVIKFIQESVQFTAQGAVMNDAPPIMSDDQLEQVMLGQLDGGWDNTAFHVVPGTDPNYFQQSMGLNLPPEMGGSAQPQVQPQITQTQFARQSQQPRFAEQFPVQQPNISPDRVAQYPAQQQQQFTQQPQMQYVQNPVQGQYGVIQQQAPVPAQYPPTGYPQQVVVQPQQVQMQPAQQQQAPIAPVAPTAPIQQQQFTPQSVPMTTEPESMGREIGDGNIDNVREKLTPSGGE